MPTIIAFKTGTPSAFCEWKTTSVNIVITVAAPQVWATATLDVYLRYHSGVNIRQFTVTGITYPAASPQEVPVNIQLSYTCLDNVQLYAVLTTNTAGLAPNVTHNVTDGITAATPVYTGGPYGTYLGGDSRNACRWTKEQIRLRMCDGAPANEADVAAHLLSYFGQNVNPDTLAVITTHSYGLSSADGIAFDNLADSPIVASSFSNGTMDLKLKMTRVAAAGDFELTNQTYLENIITSSPINIQSPTFQWFNIGNRTAYEVHTAGEIRAENTISAPVPFYDFPSANFLIASNPADTAEASHSGFAGSGTLKSADMIVECAGVHSGITLPLTNVGDASACSTSPSFDINAPLFSFTGGPFARSPKRFYSGESNSFSITAKTPGGAVINGLPSNNDWDLSGMQSAIAGKQLVNGELDLTGQQFPVNTIVQDYTLTIQRTTEVSLTGTTAIHLVGKVTLDAITPVGDDVTITGRTETQAAGVQVTVSITGPSNFSQDVVTTNATGAFTAVFNNLPNGNNYSATAKEKDDPGVSSQSNARTFNINVAYLPPAITIDLTDGADPVQHLEQPSFIISPPLLEHATRAVLVNIATASPSVAPVANLFKPDGTSIAFTFTASAGGYTSDTLDEGDFNTDGVYTVSVNEYTDNHGLKGGPVVRRFILSQPANRVTAIDQIEGWGFYPREEGILAGGIITGCSENSLLAASERWKEDAGGTAALSVSMGNPLTITSAGGTVKTLSRTYGKIFNSNGEAVTGSAYAYLEAGITLSVTSAGNTINAKDQYGNAISFTSTGVGLSMRNGPYTMKVIFVKITAGAFTGMRLAAKLSDTDGYCISGTVVNWADGGGNSIPLIIRLEKTFDGTDEIYQVKYKAVSAADWSDSGLSLPVYRLPNENTANLYQACVRFGHFDNNNQGVAATWEFVRYAFYDAEYELGESDTYRLGFEATQIAEDNGTFFRSPGLLLKNPATNADLGDQPIIGNNWVVSHLYRSISKPAFAGVNIPVKIRYSIAEWNDTADNSAAGFLKANFPEYYPAAGNQFSALDPTGSTIALSMADSPSADTSNKTWNFVFNQAAQNNLRRRLFILAYADAPFLEAPALLSGKHTDDYLKNDLPSKTDFRCAVRQFLPDFYVRDLVSDNGLGTSCSGSSPDIRTAVFGGDGSTYNPHDYSAGVRYPAGYCRDEPPIASSPFETYNDETPDAADANNGIKMTTNAWIDNGAVPASYFNRVWVKLSNRGVIAGPAKVQIFYCDSQLRSDFVPALSRDNLWEQILGNTSAGVVNTENKYVQDKFIKFDPLSGSAYPMATLDAVPALCGNSAPAGIDKIFPLAEFKWYIPNTANVPAGTSIRHGCLTAFINQPGFTSDVDTARRTDSGPLSGTPDPSDPGVDIWSITTYSNNVSVKNHNIIDATDPSQINTFALITIGEDDSPVNFRESPVNYTMTFPRKSARWGLRIDGKKFYGRLVLKIPEVICKDVRLIHFTEVKRSVKELDRKEPIKQPQVSENCRFFELQEGTVGEILNFTPARTKKDEKTALYNQFKAYFLPHPRKEKKIIQQQTYTLRLEQTADRKVIGAYITDIRMLSEKEAHFVGDRRKGIAYRVSGGKDAPDYFSEKVIPYQYREPFMGPGVAQSENYKLTEEELKKLDSPLKLNEMMNPMERKKKS
jgi:hypothetical protein